MSYFPSVHMDCISVQATNEQINEDPREIEWNNKHPAFLGTCHLNYSKLIDILYPPLQAENTGSSKRMLPSPSVRISIKSMEQTKE